MRLLDSFGGHDGKVKSFPNGRRIANEPALLKRRTDIEAQLGMLASLSGERGTRVYPNR